MRKVIKTFKNVRARIHGSEDELWYAGWVVHLAQEEARIRLQSFRPLMIGQCVVGECYGDGTLVRFTGKVLAQSGQDVSIAIQGSMTFEPSRDTVRFQVENVSGTLRDGSGDSTLMVLDISPQSLGGLCTQAYTPSATLSMSLATPNGMFDAKVAVVNCRADTTEVGCFRLGLNILEANRLDAALWQRFLDQLAEI